MATWITADPDPSVCEARACYIYSQVGGPVVKSTLPQAPDVHDFLQAGKALTQVTLESTFGCGMILCTQMYTKEAIAEVINICPFEGVVTGWRGLDMYIYP